MWRSYLGFVLLMTFAGVYTQALRSCNAPTLDEGYVVPAEEKYDHGKNLSYSCKDGFRPAADGWWATATCQDGTWSPEPLCIDKNACLPPTVANGNYDKIESGIYPKKHSMPIRCDKGYERQGQRSNARCSQGLWSPLPSCQKRPDACEEPPRIPNAVILGDNDAKVFAKNVQVVYNCKEGFTTEEGTVQTIATCTDGNWVKVPSCRPSPSPGDSQPAVTNGPSPSPGDSQPAVTNVEFCGPPPTIGEGDVLERHSMSLKYSCNLFYKMIGPEHVVCYSNGRWSELPQCKAAFCKVPQQPYPNQLIFNNDEYLGSGERRYYGCVNRYFAYAECIETVLSISSCSHYFG